MHRRRRRVDRAARPVGNRDLIASMAPGFVPQDPQLATNYLIDRANRTTVLRSDSGRSRQRT